MVNNNNNNNSNTDCKQLDATLEHIISVYLIVAKEQNIKRHVSVY